MMLRRVFIALFPPPAVRLWLADYSQRLPNRRLRAVNPDNYHVTLTYIGDLPAAELEQVGRLVQKLRQRLPLTLEVDGAMILPAAHGDIVTARIVPGPELEALVTEIRKQLQQVQPCITREKSFRPHITLARARHTNPGGPIVPPLGRMSADFYTLGLYHGQHSDAGYQYQALLR